MTFSVSSVRIQECGRFSFREHVALKGSVYADLRSLTAGQQLCLLVLFLLSCIIFVPDRGSHLKRLSSAPRHYADADLRESHAERYKSYPPRPIESHGGVDRRSHACRLFK
jgi:hypothetical protein